MEFIEVVVGSPPDGWVRGYVTVQLERPRTRKPVEAWRRGAFAVHEVNGLDGKRARLTHAPTGLRIWTFTTMDEAAECGERIEGIADFEKITAVLPSGSDVYPKVRKVIDEIECRAA